MDYSPWDHKESDMTTPLTLYITQNASAIPKKLWAGTLRQEMNLYSTLTLVINESMREKKKHEDCRTRIGIIFPEIPRRVTCVR